LQAFSLAVDSWSLILHFTQMLLNSLWASSHLICLRLGINLPSLYSRRLISVELFFTRNVTTFLVPHLYYIPHLSYYS